MKDSLVVAFGGNAIMASDSRGTAAEQRENVRRMSAELGRVIAAGYRVVVTHGNGPQVGEIMLKSELARDIVPPITLDLGGAMSQGQIGYLLQQEIGNVVRPYNPAVQVCTLVTQVVVDALDGAFDRPTKPIGRFYSEAEAQGLARDRKWVMRQDAGRGFRRIVASPRPVTIVEWPAIRALIDCGVVVIAAGGGGIPVVRENGTLRGVEAVIDKDFAAQRLAALVGADTLALLTGVDAVAVHFGTPEEHSLGVVGLTEIEEWYSAGHFAPGSMGPKVRAAIDFVEGGGRRAIITSPQNLMGALENAGGTQIVAATRRGGRRASPLAGAPT